MQKNENLEILDTSEEVPKVKRKLLPIQQKILTLLAIAFSLFQLITIFYPVDTIQQRAIHLLFALLLVFIIYPVRGKWADKFYIIDYIFLTGTLFAGIYLVIESHSLMVERLGEYNSTDVVVAVILVALVLEATRRVFGWILLSIAIAGLLYTYFGDYLPGVIGHKGYSVYRIATTMSLWTEGIFGSPLGVSSTFVAVFVIFGSFLNQTGIGEFIIRFAYAYFGGVRGGPAKAAVVGSGLMGTVSGSAVANVVTTGTFTIPLMKKVGFKPEFAGAVEAVASSGGQLVPPVMGATAFIIAEMVGVPYTQIITAAIIPALLYYLCLYFTIDACAGRMGLMGEKKENLEDWRGMLKGNWYLFLPILVLIYALAVMNVSTSPAAFGAIVCTLLIYWYKQKSKFEINVIMKSLEQGGYGILEVAIVTAVAGIITGVLSLTGLGLKVSGLLVGLAGGNLLVLLILSMIVSIIAGMGLPIVACYLLLAVLVAPALVQMGVNVLAAHLFIFMFGIFSAITPPVAIAAYVASGIAKSNPMKTGVMATKIALPLFLIPYTFAYNPTLIMIGSMVSIAVSFITALMGIFFFACALQGYLISFRLNTMYRLIVAVGAILSIVPELYTDILGLCIELGVLASLYLARKKTVNSTSL